MPFIVDAGRLYCRRAVRESGSNFYYALWMLPPSRREAMFAVYSFCRAVDDVVDSGWPVDRASQELERWRQELTGCYEGWPAHPITQALAGVVRTFSIPRALLDDLLVGMSWDLAARRYETFEELERYCYHVAGVVGLMAIRVFGCRRPESEQFAQHLGTAFQLTNILRDIREDAARGRMYLPLEDLKRFEVSAEAVLRGAASDRLRRLLAFEGERAKAFFDRAQAAVSREDRRALAPALAMASVNRRILSRLEARRYAPGLSRVRLPIPEKMWLALRGAMGGSW